MTASPRARLQLAREPRFIHADGRVQSLVHKDALLLAYLAIEGPTRRAVLAALLWPDVDAERARANMRQRLLRLRRAVGRDLLEEGEVAALCVDLATDLDAGADTVGADLLQGVVEGDAGGLAEWLGSTRERRRSAHLSGLAERSSQLEAGGQLGLALDTARQLVDADPTSEHGHRRLMRLHYLRGDRAAALAAFDQCCDMLERVLGVAPDAETEALRARVEAGTLEHAPTLRRPLPLSVLRPPRLIAREAEWEAIEAAWTAGTASLIGGEAGLGKSRLVGDFALAHAQALMVEARPGDDRVPHALLARLLRQVLQRMRAPTAPGVTDELAHLLPELRQRPAAARGANDVRFIHAVETVLRQARSEGLAGLVLDDLQYADAASIEVLQQLVVGDIDLRWVVAFRPDELAPAARRFHDQLLDSGGARLHLLRPLATAQIAELIDSLGVAELDAGWLSPALASHSGGNPLFLLETLKLMLGTGGAATAVVERPGTRLPSAGNVIRLIEQRIGRLSPLAVKLARCAAIAGADFSPELAAHVLGLRALDLSDAWAELEAAQVLRDGRFAHDLILEAARDSVPAPIARWLHAEMAGFLEARGAEPARVAQHWLDSGDETKALPSLVAAADRAAAAWRPQEEGALLLQAARISLRAGAERAAAFALLQRAHRACLQSGLAGGAHQEVLDALAASAETPLEQGYAHYARADTLAQGGSGPPAEAEARAGLALIAAESGRLAESLHVDLVSALANALFLQDRPLEGVDAVRAAQPRLLKLSDRPREIDHYTNLGVLLDAADEHAEGQAATRHGLALARAQGDRIGELVLLNNLAFSLHDVGRVGDALLQMQEVDRLKHAYPELRTGGLFVRVQMGNMQRSMGDYAAALDHLEAGLAVVDAYSPLFSAAVHNSLAHLYLDLGQPSRSQQHLQKALGIDAAPPLFRAMSHLLRARSALEQSRPRIAAVALQAAGECIGPSTRYAVRGHAALCGARLQEPEAAYLAAAEVAAEAGRLQMQGLRMHALAAAATHALACGLAPVAATHAVEAMALWPEHAADDLYVGAVWLAAVDALQAAGDPRAAAVQSSACDWIAATARDRVPAAFRESFLHRNAVNRALIAHPARPA